MWAIRAFSVRLSILFILAVPCQISDQLSATKHHGEHRSNITSRSKEGHLHPQITRITVDTRRSAAPQHNNPRRRQPAGLNASPYDWDGSAADARSSSDAASLSRIWHVMLGGRPDNVRLPSRRQPIILVSSRRPVGRTHPVQRSFSGIDSGVHLRLKGNSSLNEGLVEVLVNGRWGFICNDDHWNAEEAKVVCQQLGFTSTADTSVRTSRIGSHEPFVMSNVVCNGSESRIQDCVYRESTTCSNRKPARVYCALNSGCQVGWLSANGFCYKLVKSVATFDESEARCRSLDAYLVKIETQRENNFLSSMLMAERAEGAVWTSGRRTERNGQVEWRWLGASHALRFTKWFPGWNMAGLQRQPNTAANQSCMALAKAFTDSDGTNQEVDYHFWMALPCTQKFPFFCKKVVHNNDCYEGNGVEYRGSAFVTTRASLCQKWTASNRINPVTHPSVGLGDHNYCRNPDGDERPWCWVDADHGRFGYCALSSCPGLEASVSTPPNIEIPMIKVRLRGGRHDHEGRVEVWHGREWGSVCDDQWGLPDAEVVCRQLGYVGALRTSSLLEFSTHDGVNIILDEVECTGLENSLYECAHSPWGDHDCRSIETAGVVCKPNKVCVEEKEIACSGSNGQTCVPLSYVCDREPDCSDNSDEANCSHMEVALVGGSRPSEGRVEITINNVTGTVCDDDWDDRDAAVICRMIGYSTGVAQAVTGAQFGRGKGPIWLDNVDCAGDEDDIQDCEHPTWGEHNCMHNEDAGVSCLTSGRTFPPRITYSPVAADCGRRPIRQVQGKIVGGQYAMYGAYPWQARILKRNLMNEFVHSCGGTVIGQHWILSAAHCFEHTSIADLRIRIGDHRSTSVDSHEQDFAVERLFLHPSYSNIILFLFGSARYDNDIALVKVRSIGLRSGIVFSNYVQPACLPSSSAEYSPGLVCEVSGWGLNGRSTPSVLMFAVVPIKQFSECQSLYKHKLSRKMFCAGYRDGRADTCQGDSGGPLVCNVNGTFKIMGITSWGLGCGIRDSPGVYTNVGEFSDWIQQTIRRHSEH